MINSMEKNVAEKEDSVGEGLQFSIWKSQQASLRK